MSKRSIYEVKSILEAEIERKSKLIYSGHKLSTQFTSQNQKASKMLETVSKWCASRPSPFAYITPDEQRIIDLYNIDMTL